ncbi:MAG: transcriptional repressor [Dehalococcoidia bacterium]|nr:transcriptional repressor [Dehalococcoidia bacterium]
MRLPINTIYHDFKARGLKATQQRLAVLAAAAHADGYFTPQGLYETLKNQCAAVGLTTVYRALEALERAGLICRIESTRDERLYAYCSRVHHHHIICDGCAQVVELDDCALPGLARQLERETGFIIRSHTLEFHGLCCTCRLETQGNLRGVA